MNSDRSAQASAADLVADLQAASLPLPVILRHLAGDLTSSGWSQGFERLAQVVEKGTDFSQALDDAAVQQNLPEHVRELLRAQHTDGLVAASLELAEIQRQGRLERERVVRSLVYPAFIMLTAMITSTLLAFITVNYITELVREMGIKVSSGAQWVHQASPALLWLGIAGMGTIAVLSAIIWIFGGTKLLASVLAEVPLLGPALRWSSVAEWLRVAAVALQRQRTMPAALRCGGDAQDDIFVADAARGLAEDIEQGTHLSIAWREQSLLPVMLVPLWNSVESLVSPQTLFHSAADLLSARATNRAELVRTILPPLLFIGIGVLIGAQLFGIFSPMRDMMSGLSGGGFPGGGPVAPLIPVDVVKVGFLIIPALAMFISLKILYGPRRSRDVFRLVFNGIAYGFLFVGICCSLLNFASIWLIPIAIVILFASWISFRRSEDRGFLQAISYAIERQIPVIDVANAFGQERFGRRPRLVALALQQGQSLSDSLRAGGIQLPSGVRAAIALGEKQANTPELLRNALRPVRPYEDALNAVIRRGMLWLFVMPISMVVYLMSSLIMPRMMAEFGLKLPSILTDGPTSYFNAHKYPWLPFIFGVVVFVAFIVMLELTIQQLGFRTFPSFPRLRRRYDSAMVLHLLAAGIQAKLTLPAIYRLLAETYDYRPIQRRLQRALQRAVQGMNPWKALQNERLLKPPEVAALEAAERAGNLPKVLENLSDTILRRLEFRLHVWSNVINMLGLLGVGFLVMMAVAWLFLPLASLVMGLSGGGRG